MMKKAFLTLLSLIITGTVFAQKEQDKAVANMAAQANPALTAAQKSTLAWVKLYDLTAEQAKETLDIQKTKFQNLSDIEPLKATNASLYIQKRLASFEIANAALKTLLDDRQLKIFEREQLANAAKYEDIVGALKKSGYSEEAIQRKLMEVEF